MSVMIVDLPDWPWQAVLQVANERGANVWLVGGAVRDALLDRPVHDWDFAVDKDALGLARSVANVLGGAYFPLDVERGAGRVVLMGADTTRLELDFAVLRGKDLEADLGTRDFTINALAVDESGALVDLTESKADLDARRIRVTNECAFQDDPVRLLRAVRMEAGLDFEIEPQTATWVRRDAALLALSSAERVRDEFVRLLMVQNAVAHLRRLDEFDLLPYVVPELESLKRVTQSSPHRFDVWQHTLLVVDTLEGVVAAVTGREVGARFSSDVLSSAWSDIGRLLNQFADDVATHLAVEVSSRRDRAGLLKLAALLHDIGKLETWSQGEDGHIHFHNHDLVGAQMAATRLQELRFSRDEVERMRVLVGQHLRPAHLARAEHVTRRAVYRYFRATGCGGVDVVLLALADHLATYGPNLQEDRWARMLEMAETLLTHCFKRYEETVDPPTLVTGGDLLGELEMSPGPRVGWLLETVREAQAAGEIQTREEALAFASRIAERT
ncbi:MAG: HD domain-containing protein [Chloroflexi bacterium]|nr:HD domain-containing protein [Chloroflexota bacterium]